jgi:hypothetical protein
VYEEAVNPESAKDFGRYREHGPSSKSPRKQKTSAESGYKRYREFKMRVSLFTADVSSFAQTPQCDASTN